MKTTVKYFRPWYGPNANKLVVQVNTAQHGRGELILCAEELTRLHSLFNEHFNYTDNDRRSDYSGMRLAVARALADYIAQYMPNELKVERES